MSRRPLFPCYIAEAAAERFASKDQEFTRELDNRRTFMTSMAVHGQLSQDKKLELYAHMSTDDGFCWTSGVFWRKTIAVTDDQLQAFVERELCLRAVAEINEEDEIRWRERVEARVTAMRQELL